MLLPVGCTHLPTAADSVLSSAGHWYLHQLYAHLMIPSRCLAKGGTVVMAPNIVQTHTLL